MNIEEKELAKLGGKYKHFCNEWDDLAIDETCSEFECCTCFSGNSEVKEIQNKLSKERNDQMDKEAAEEIKAGRCPFNQLRAGQTMGHCHLGFPGCACADEYLTNPYLKDLDSLPSARLKPKDKSEG